MVLGIGLLSELLSAAQWYLLIVFIGIISLPLTVTICRNLPDRGYSVSKILGILLLAYVSWILSYALGYSRNEIMLSLFLVCLFSAVIYLKTKPKIDRKLLLRNELIFGAVFLLFLIIRAYNPDIHDGEKVFDFMLLNSILNSASLPPHDSWLSGFNIDMYYYFGAFTIATLTKLIGIPSNITYNLGMSLLPALSALAASGLGYNLTGDKKGGIVAVFLLVFAGNLYPAGVISAHALNMTTSPWGNVPGIMDYWGPTRIIPNTANEFPYFSFIFGDLHAHVIAIPFVLMAITFILNIYLSKKLSKTALVLMSLALGSLFVSNSWDYATYSALFGLAILIQPWKIELNKPGEIFRDLIKRSGIVIAVPILGLLMFIFFFIDFHSSSIQGIKPVITRTALLNFLVIYDLFLFLIASFLLMHLPEFKYKNWILAALSAAAVALYFVPNFQTLAVFVPLSILTCFGVYFFYRNKDINRLFISVIIALGLSILVFCELFYFDDLFSGADERFNTVFKYYIQVWLLFSIASAYAFYDIIDKKYRMKRAVLVILSILLVINSLYLFTGTFARTAEWKGSPGLDGIAFLKKADYGDYDAIVWAGRNLNGTQVILEAPGVSYKDDSRISAFTGIPTVVGWAGHEYVLRNNWGEISARIRDVDIIYDTENNNEAMVLLRKYNVSYVYVGNNEQRKYQQRGLQKFENTSYFEKVYRGVYEIYRVLH
jgi:YYY domain-containing protein